MSAPGGPSAAPADPAPGGRKSLPAAGAAAFLPPSRSFYAEVGGHQTFRALVAGFYRGVPDDPVLAGVYPPDSLGPAEEHLRMFLEQYWGGPDDYSRSRGHPRLRRRHAPFRITPAVRDAWLARMRTALDQVGLTADADHVLWQYLVAAAESLVNAPAE